MSTFGLGFALLHLKMLMELGLVKSEEKYLKTTEEDLEEIFTG